MSRATEQPSPGILVVQTARLGDLVLTVPLLRELRRVAGPRPVTLLTTQTGRSLLQHQGLAERILVLEKRWNPGGLRSTRRIAGELSSHRFEWAVAVQRSWRTGAVVRWSRAEVRVGFAGAPGSWAYTHPVRRDPELHAAERLLQLSGPLGGDPARADPVPKLRIGAAGGKEAAELLRRHGVDDGQPTVCIAPGSARATKRWTVAGFAATLRQAIEHRSTPVLVGSADERPLCDEIARVAGVRAAVLAGDSSLPVLAALLARSRLAICNDSGPGHLAAAVGCAVVSVFGPTAPEFGFAPRGRQVTVVEHPDLDCRPCSPRGPRSCPRVHFRCMKDLSPDRVLAAMNDVLGPMV